MDALVGKHKGKSMEELVLKHPDYIHWLLQQPAQGPLLAMKNEAKRLIQKFDSKRYTNECFEGDGQPATRLSVYGDNIQPMWWCATCDPYGQGANPGKLQMFHSYMDALHHVQWHCAGKKGDYQSLIKDMAKAKSLPARVGATQARAFFV